jgi:hypothetical protein
MAVGFPTKANWAAGDVLTASAMDDLAGTVNLLNPLAKGGLVAGSGSNTTAVLTVGSNNALVTADSTQTTGLKYAGLWTTFTPTITGITLGNGSKAGTYCQIADTTFFRVVLTFGSTTSITGAVDLTLPTTPSGYGTFDFMNCINQVYKYSSTTFYPSSSNINVGGNTVRAAACNVAGTYATYTDVGATAPIVFTTSDSLTWQGSYRNS